MRNASNTFCHQSFSRGMPCSNCAGNLVRRLCSEEGAEIGRESFVAFKPGTPMRKPPAATPGQQAVISRPCDQLQMPQQGIIAYLLCQRGMVENVAVSICRDKLALGKRLQLASLWPKLELWQSCFASSKVWPTAKELLQARDMAC